MRIFYVDGTGTSTVSSTTLDPTLEEKREPLWRRDMPGLKHIRGILYEEYPDMVYEDRASHSELKFRKKSIFAGHKKCIFLHFQKYKN